MSDDPEFLTPKEAAALLGLSESWLQKRRTRPDLGGPPWRHLPGTRRVRYPRAGLMAWLADGGGAQLPRPLRWKDMKGTTWADTANPIWVQNDDKETE